MAFELQDTKVSPVENKMSLMEKLGILSDAAKYDVSCSSSGVGRRGDGTGIGNTVNIVSTADPMMFPGPALRPMRSAS